VDVDASSNNGNEGRFNLSTWWQALLQHASLLTKLGLEAF
jgi:hypothetical protein